MGASASRTKVEAMAAVAWAAALLVAASCGGTDSSPPVQDPFLGPPPLGTAIAPDEGTPIANAAGWTWVPFPDAICNDATVDGSGYVFGTSSTGLAINWGTSDDLVLFLQGGGACWDFVTCGGLKSLNVDTTAATGPFGPAEFAANVYAKYPSSWVVRGNLPFPLADATIVFVPYCTGDVHGGDRVTTYSSAGFRSVTWHHAGHANFMAFLKRLGATFPSPGKLIVAGSSAGGFGSLANYRWARWYWPNAKGYLIDDSGPPLVGDAIPATTRSAWYASWNLGASLDPFCPGCAADMSQGIAELAARFPEDRIALVSHLEDAVIRAFFGASYLTPKDPVVFEAELRALGAWMDPPAAPTPTKYFFTNSPTPTAHPALENPTQVTTPGTGLADWVAAMVDDSSGWVSLSDP